MNPTSNDQSPHEIIDLSDSDDSPPPYHQTTFGFQNTQSANKIEPTVKPNQVDKEQHQNRLDQNVDWTAVVMALQGKTTAQVTEMISNQGFLQPFIRANYQPGNYQKGNSVFADVSTGDFVHCKQEPEHGDVSPEIGFVNNDMVEDNDPEPLNLAPVRNPDVNKLRHDFVSQQTSDNEGTTPFLSEAHDLNTAKMDYMPIVSEPPGQIHLNVQPEESILPPILVDGNSSGVEITSVSVPVENAQQQFPMTSCGAEQSLEKSDELIIVSANVETSMSAPLTVTITNEKLFATSCAQLDEADKKYKEPGPNLPELQKMMEKMDKNLKILDNLRNGKSFSGNRSLQDLFASVEKMRQMNEPFKLLASRLVASKQKLEGDEKCSQCGTVDKVHDSKKVRMLSLNGMGGVSFLDPISCPRSSKKVNLDEFLECWGYLDGPPDFKLRPSKPETPTVDKVACPVTIVPSEPKAIISQPVEVKVIDIDDEEDDDDDLVMVEPSSAPEKKPANIGAFQNRPQIIPIHVLNPEFQRPIQGARDGINRPMVRREQVASYGSQPSSIHSSPGTSRTVVASSLAKIAKFDSSVSVRDKPSARPPTPVCQSSASSLNKEIWSNANQAVCHSRGTVRHQTKATSSSARWVSPQVFSTPPKR